MKISYHSITARQVYDARLGENKVKAIYRGDVKIYPDNAARISQIRLDISAWSARRTAPSGSRPSRPSPSTLLLPATLK